MSTSDPSSSTQAASGASSGKLHYDFSAATGYILFSVDATGYEDIYGLSYTGGVLLGLTDTGELLALDVATGAGTVLYEAARSLRTLTVERDTAHLAETLAPEWAKLAYNGQWFHPAREALDALLSRDPREE